MRIDEPGKYQSRVGHDITIVYVGKYEVVGMFSGNNDTKLYLFDRDTGKWICDERYEFLKGFSRFDITEKVSQ